MYWNYFTYNILRKIVSARHRSSIDDQAKTFSAHYRKYSATDD